MLNEPDGGNSLTEFDDVILKGYDGDLDFNRFQFVEEEAWKELVQMNVAENTMKKLRFCEKLFNTWKTERNQQRGDLIPDKPIEDFTVEELNK